MVVKLEWFALEPTPLIFQRIRLGLQSGLLSLHVGFIKGGLLRVRCNIAPLFSKLCAFLVEV
jgi:hypothetical protein